MAKKKIIEDGVIPPEPQVKRIPVKLDDKTTIYVKEGKDIEKVLERYRNRSLSFTKSIE